MNPLDGIKFFIDPNSFAARSKNPVLAPIANEHYTYWYTDQYKRQNVDKRVARQIARHGDCTAILALYNIPDRDLGHHSKGGAANSKEYIKFVEDFAAGIGDASPVVILEPDALAGCQNMRPPQRMMRINLIHQAIDILGKTNARVYVDIGNPEFIIEPEDAAKILKQVGIENACGFSLNVSNFYHTDRCEEYGRQISSHLGDTHFVIDTSRNGVGNICKTEWCNPPGRRIGYKPTTETNEPLCDAYLWIKPPGESDGACNGGPKAGAFWEEYAEELCK